MKSDQKQPTSSQIYVQGVTNFRDMLDMVSK